MLSSTLFLAAAAFSSFAVAQNNSNPSALPAGISNCCQVNPNDVPDDMKSEWCQAERNTCPEICGGVNQLASGGQTCDTDTLEFTCKCRNGTEPNMAEFEQSVPGQMCRFWFDQCINATNENLEQQVECQNQRQQFCGNRTSDNGESKSSSSATSSPTGTSSGGGDNSPSSTGPSPSSSSTGAATALAIARDYGTPLLAGGFAAIFGLAL